MLLQKKFPNLEVLLKLGSKGSAFIDKKGKLIRQIALNDPMLKIVDTTGAGDCFTAAFSVAYAQGKSIEEALRFGSAAAFLCITKKGALPSMPKLSDVENFLNNHPSK